MKIELLNKEYYAESINDIGEDIYWEIQDSKKLDKATKDEHGFEKGTYKLILTYEE